MSADRLVHELFEVAAYIPWDDCDCHGFGLKQVSRIILTAWAKSSRAEVVHKGTKVPQMFATLYLPA